MYGQATSTFITGQAAIAVAGTAVQIGTSVNIQNGVIVKADANNTDPILVGTASVNDTSDGTGNGYVLYPGENVAIATTNISSVYVNGANAGDSVSWLAN